MKKTAGFDNHYVYRTILTDCKRTLTQQRKNAKATKYFIDAFG